MGATDLASRTRAATADALAKATALAEARPPDLAAARAAREADVRALYEAIRGVTAPLKTEFLSVLDLEAATQAEGDND